MLHEAKVLCKTAMCRTNVRKPGNMLICCVETNPVGITKENKVSEETYHKEAYHATPTVVWAVIWSVGGANKIQPGATDRTTACHTSARARMHGRMTPW